MIKFFQTKNKNFKSFRFFLQNPCLRLLGRYFNAKRNWVYNKSTKNLGVCLQTGSGISAHAHWSSFCVAAQGHSSCSKKVTGTEFDLIIYINYIWSLHAVQGWPIVLRNYYQMFYVFLCVNVRNDIRIRGLFKEYSYPAAGIYHARYLSRG